MKRSYWLFTFLVLLGCAKVLAVRQIPEITLGEATFFPTIEAHTDAPIINGNWIEVLLNGVKHFPECCETLEQRNPRLHSRNISMKTVL
jgi:hypothetical protein